MQLTEKNNNFINALNAYTDDETIVVTPDELFIMMECGENDTILSSLEDFTGQVNPVQNKIISETDDGLDVKGTIKVKYKRKQENYDEFIVRIKYALYVSDSTVRLLCPQKNVIITGNQADKFDIKTIYLFLIIMSMS